MPKLDLPRFECVSTTSGEAYRGVVHLDDFGGHYLLPTSDAMNSEQRMQKVIELTIAHFEKKPTLMAKLTCANNTYNIRENSNQKCAHCIHWYRVPDSSYSACYTGYCGNHNKINRGILPYINRLNNTAEENGQRLEDIPILGAIIHYFDDCNIYIIYNKHNFDCLGELMKKINQKTEGMIQLSDVRDYVANSTIFDSQLKEVTKKCRDYDDPNYDPDYNPDRVEETVERAENMKKIRYNEKTIIRNTFLWEQECGGCELEELPLVVSSGIKKPDKRIRADPIYVLRIS